jgi:hypothetical protein
VRSITRRRLSLELPPIQIGIGSRTAGAARPRRAAKCRPRRAERRAAPVQRQRLQGLVEACVALLEVHPERVELRLLVSGAQPEDEPAGRDAR